MTDTPKTVFVTRNVLKEGIRELEPYKDHGDGYLSVKGDSHIIGRREWHLTREAAVTRANAMRDTKLASLHQQAERPAQTRRTGHQLSY